MSKKLLNFARYLIFISICIELPIITSLPLENQNVQNQDVHQLTSTPLALASGSIERSNTWLENPKESYDIRVNNTNQKRVLEANGYLFEIPSYASGITDIKPPSNELLPPLFAEQKQSKTINFKPSVDLLPPFDSVNTSEGSQTETTIPNYEAEHTTQEYHSSNKQQLLPVLNNERNDTFENITTSPINYTDTSKIDQPKMLPARFGTNFPEVFSPPGSQIADKYTGGFGGSPGVLGEQKVFGSAVQPDGTIKDIDTQGNQHPPNPAINFTTHTPSIFTNKFNQSHSANNHVTHDSKYTGGFGGPPGILLPYDDKQK